MPPPAASTDSVAYLQHKGLSQKTARQTKIFVRVSLYTTMGRTLPKGTQKFR